MLLKIVTFSSSDTIKCTKKQPLRRGKTGPEKAEIDAKIELKNAEIKKCRHDIKLCNFITDNYEQMTENIDPSKEKQMREKSKYDLVKEELSRSSDYSKDYEYEKEI